MSEEKINFCNKIILVLISNLLPRLSEQPSPVGIEFNYFMIFRIMAIYDVVFDVCFITSLQIINSQSDQSKCIVVHVNLQKINIHLA